MLGFEGLACPRLRLRGVSAMHASACRRSLCSLRSTALSPYLQACRLWPECGCVLQDYIFPEEAGAAPNLKLLEAAQRWKQAQASAALANGS